jgi:cobalt-precorrin-5B (C1)-methyltransferase
MMNEKALCTARELAIGYGKTPLLSDICLGVQPGQILTLIGPNGAGKSTLLRTLAGQLAPMGGTVLLAGKDLTAYTGTQRAQKLALMAPHSRRMELTTCFDFVSAGRYPYTGRLGILSAEDRQQVHRALELVGAAHLADRDFNRISDGQRQRILLARALCQQPEVILLDEPTSFLDIKGKIELLTILKELAHTGQLAVILSLHELELAEKIADTVVCVSPGGVSGVLTPEQAFQPENIRTLYGLTEQQYTALFGTPEPEAEKAPAGKPQFEHYVRSGQKLLRCGYTTGTCAALGAAGAARLLLTGREPETVALRTPKGIVVEVAPLWCRSTDTGAACAIRKDGGDDVDVTTGLPVVASVVLEPDAPGVRIFGGEGVGRVTKPGLDQPVGQAAINHVPRQMITEALRREAEAACYPGGFAVTISIPGGEEVARRTFNPHIGVEGGLSVLGTSGIVEPMSQQAILDTIQLEMNQAALRAKDHRRLILAPGNYGLDYLHETYPQFADIPVVKTSNFIGDTLDIAAAAHFKQVLLVGHIGKLCKLAGGIMNTHSHTADCRTELFCTHAALCGADREVCTALYNAATTDACLEILDTAGLREPVLQSLLAAIQLYLDRRAGGAFRVGAVLFSNQHGPLGQTETAARLLNEWKE